MNRHRILTLLLVGLISCNGFQSQPKIMEALKENCDCDDIRMIEFHWEDYKTTAHFELIGCEFDSLESEQNRVIEILKQVDGFCDINRITLDFINKMEHHPLVLRKCNR